MPGPYTNPYAVNNLYGYGYPYQPTYQPMQTAPAVPQQTAAPMTPPTVHVDIIRVNSVEEVTGYPVNAGTTQMFQLGDGEAFITKEVLANGQANIDIYPKQPKKPAPPPVDLSQFVTWDALEEKLAGLNKRRGRRQDETGGDGQG